MKTKVRRSEKEDDDELDVHFLVGVLSRDRIKTTPQTANMQSHKRLSTHINSIRRRLKRPWRRFGHGPLSLKQTRRSRFSLIGLIGLAV